ncbi:MAG: Crp/Fnr family transcriptional regulator [Proteobacteria bacterium]|nr:Crp/Fnr family transcriptional regulator [Cystobacterineae bacterium]MCL2259428.1 Crp/Fnr family transcriptional regulator [Cystobacterineae bacterium]MCL2315312.1 Crp/Fnr family transcriptional regulator [Pseudomonadota bacterium]
MNAEDTLFQRFGKEVPAGTVLFREGETGKEMFVLQAGQVSISKRVRDIEKILAVLGPGEFFGEMAIISNKVRNASAVADKASRLLVIDSRTFETMVRTNAEIAVRMIRKLAERLSDADAQIESLLLADPPSRIVHCILQACQLRGTPIAGGVEVQIALKELPSELGVGEAALGYWVYRLESMGLIIVGPDKLVIPAPARLGEFLQYLDMRWKYGEF